MAGQTCPRCGAEAPAGQWGCAVCGASLYLPPDQDPTSPRKSCASCGGPTESGWLALQTGDFFPVPAGFVFQGPSGSRAGTLETETCTACGHVDLYRR